MKKVLLILGIVCAVIVIGTTIRGVQHHANDTTDTQTEETEDTGKLTGKVLGLFEQKMETYFDTNITGFYYNSACWFDDSIGSYIAKGSFNADGIDFDFNFRCYIDDTNTADFVKIDVVSALGEKVIDYYNMDAEIEYMDNYSAKK